MKLTMRLRALAGLAATPLLFATAAVAQTSSAGSSEPVLWNCTGSPCPWGGTDPGIALVWPEGVGATSTRHGYTTTKPVYLPAYAANGAVVQITSGRATVYAGLPLGGGHRVLSALNAGDGLTVSGLAAGEVLSVQSGESFAYQIMLPSATPPPPPPPPPPAPGTTSVLITWTCTGSPCPWGPTDSGHAIEWPNVPERISTRYGYTTSHGAYLGAARANGTTIHIHSGSASVYAGTPNAQHRLLAGMAAGGTFEVSGLAPDEMLSVQSSTPFQYEVTLAPAPTTPPPPPPPPAGTPSQPVIWQCTGSPCPLGATVSEDALVWPASASPTATKLGYTASRDVYLPHNYVAGTTITVTSGSVTAFADVPGGILHHALTTISAGGTYTFPALAAGQVLSIVGDDGEFRYELALGAFVPDPEPTEPEVPGDPNAVIQSVASEWRCDIPGCSYWYSHVIDWPSWAAYSDNARADDKHRQTYGEAGQLLHPYMGSWADGCRVTAVSGVVLIIEWQRGAEAWRETYLDPGQTHIIRLEAPEDGAMIESYDFSPGFSVTLQNCTPRPLP